MQTKIHRHRIVSEPPCKMRGSCLCCASYFGRWTIEIVTRSEQVLRTARTRPVIWDLRRRSGGRGHRAESLSRHEQTGNRVRVARPAVMSDNTSDSDWFKHHGMPDKVPTRWIITGNAHLRIRGRAFRELAERKPHRDARGNGKRVAAIAIRYRLIAV
jgi:hypothetical protein